MRTAEHYRREGMADACVLIVASRCAPSVVRLVDLGRACGLTDVEAQAAVARFRQRGQAALHAPKQRRRRGRNEGLPADRKWCSRCSLVLPIDRFTSGTAAWCRTCTSAYNAERYRRDKARRS